MLNNKLTIHKTKKLYGLVSGNIEDTSIRTKEFIASEFYGYKRKFQIGIQSSYKDNESSNKQLLSTVKSLSLKQSDNAIKRNKIGGSKRSKVHSNRSKNYSSKKFRSQKCRRSRQKKRQNKKPNNSRIISSNKTKRKYYKLNFNKFDINGNPEHYLVLQ
ncbi:hypothetical protein [Acanthamoeba polyphaga mimivirus]|nr:hypothetical protein [Acanthamoeba castellanii mamavirus]EJN40660.1 hypothetical protein lvs_L154 [Acanthamoeba polyphaga lentillevirus]UMZ08289.1 hypothetical protein [Acanthamoeba polyphaga mimivirus]